MLELVGKVKKHGVIGDGTENINPDGPVDLLRQAAAVSTRRLDRLDQSLHV